MQNKLKIIGGTWRSRTLKIVEVPGLRPTPQRVRETVFNWLRDDIYASRCLDLYAGSGALGFEAASRGAAVVVAVDSNLLACKAIKENAELLNASQLTIITSDVLSFLATRPQVFDVVFIDPPFALNLVVPTCQWLEDKGWLERHAKIYVESQSTVHNLEKLPENWRQLKDKTAGEVRYQLFERNA